MAVLCEAISVVIDASRAVEAFGSFDEFKTVVPNSTLAADNEVIRVGFMVPDDVQAFIEILEERGLRYVSEGKARDMVVIDQLRGPAVRCDWIEFGHVDIHGRSVAAARAKGSQSKKLITPEGWQVEGSLSDTFGFKPSGLDDKSLVFLRSDDGVDVYLNRLTGEEVYVGRTSDEGR